MEPKKTEIKTLGELGLVERIRQASAPANPDTVAGIGDDAAALDPAGKIVVAATDTMTEGVHFDLTYFPLEHLGYKAASMALSDIYAMNAQPRQLLVSVALSAKFGVEHVDALYDGIRRACRRHGADLAGGDTTASANGLAITVTALGLADPGHLVRRSGARPGDLVYVSGDLGSAFLGLKLLEREKRVLQAGPGARPALEGYEHLVEKQLKPEARRDTIEALRQAGVLPTAMIDVSEGLASDLRHLARASGAGFRVYDEKIPIHPQSDALCDEFRIAPTAPALNGGEDLELLFTVAQADHGKMSQVPGVSVIGHMTADPQQAEIVFADGATLPLESPDWAAYDQGE